MAEYPKTLVNSSKDERVVDSKADEAAWKFRGYAEKAAKAKPSEAPRQNPVT